MQKIRGTTCDARFFRVVKTSQFRWSAAVYAKRQFMWEWYHRIREWKRGLRSGVGEVMWVLCRPVLALMEYKAQF